MSRRANALMRCARCRVHQSLCFCDRIPRLETRTRLVLLIHRREDRKPTNTGRLAAACLPNSEVWLRGQMGRNDAEFTLDSTRQALLLYPSAEARPITDYAASGRPITLVVPDGNWRQASKIRTRVPALADVPLVGLPADLPSSYRLRHESQPGGLATMEAIARALGVLEGQKVRASLEQVFRILVERTLWARGALDAAQVTDGLPRGALRHDPQSGTEDPTRGD